MPDAYTGANTCSLIVFSNLVSCAAGGVDTVENGILDDVSRTAKIQQQKH